MGVAHGEEKTTIRHGEDKEIKPFVRLSTSQENPLGTPRRTRTKAAVVHVVNDDGTKQRMEKEQQKTGGAERTPFDLTRGG